MAYYHCLLLDADNTLLDFEATEHKALLETFAEFEVPAEEETLEQYHQINKGLWAALDRGEICIDRLATERFVRLGQTLGLRLDAARMEKGYQDNLAKHADLLSGVLEAVRELSEVATLAIVSNGFERVQTSRLALSGLDRYMDGVFISEKVGAAKPNRRVFEAALNALGVENRDKVLVVGDSLRTDILGGSRAGLHTSWLNADGAEPEGGVQPTYTITRLEELYPIVMEEEELLNVGAKNRKHQI